MDAFVNLLQFVCFNGGNLFVACTVPDYERERDSLLTHQRIRILTLIAEHCSDFSIV